MSGLDDLDEHALRRSGLMNATREPRIPARGCSSMSAMPASRTDASAA